MKRKVNNIYILLISLLSALGCKDNQSEPTKLIDGSRTPKSEYGTSLDMARDAASDIEERDKSIKEQSEAIFEE